MTLVVFSTSTAARPCALVSVTPRVASTTLTTDSTSRLASRTNVTAVSASKRSVTAAPPRAQPASAASAGAVRPTPCSAVTTHTAAALSCASASEYLSSYVCGASDASTGSRAVPSTRAVTTRASDTTASKRAALYGPNSGGVAWKSTGICSFPGVGRERGQRGDKIQKLP
jgi:hypothetical protein